MSMYSGVKDTIKKDIAREEAKDHPNKMLLDAWKDQYKAYELAEKKMAQQSALKKAIKAKMDEMIEETKKLKDKNSSSFESANTQITAVKDESRNCFKGTAGSKYRVKVTNKNKTIIGVKNDHSSLVKLSGRKKGF